MKKLFSLSLLAFVLLTFYGCPVSSTYPLGKPGEHKIDLDFVGKWTSTQAEEASEVIISKKDNYNYIVEVTEQGEMFSAETDVFTGWLTEINGKKFFCLQENETSYYVYHIDKINKDLFNLYDISLKVKGTEAITSINAYREEVVASMKHSDFLASSSIWSRQK